MKVIMFDKPKLPDFRINSLIKVYTIGKNKPKVYLGKILLSDNNECYFMVRFLKDSNLQSKFYKKYQDETSELFRIVEESQDKDELILNLNDKFDFILKDNFTLEDIYTDVDIGDKQDYLSDISLDDLPTERVKIDDEDSLELANEIVNEIEDTISKSSLKITNEQLEEEIVKEKYKRKGFRKDAKSQLVPIKIVRKDGIQATYYIKANKVEKYQKENKIVNGRWKYEFYTDEVEKSMRSLDKLGLKEHLDGFTKSGKYGTAGTMSGTKIMVEKYLDGLGVGNETKPVQQILKGKDFYHEKLSVGDNLEAVTRINFKDRVDFKNGTSVKVVEIDSTIKQNGNETRNNIQGVYTRKPKDGRIFNSFHINKVKGNLSKDQIAYMTDAHMKTHDMISVKINGIENKDNIRKFLMAGYNWDKDTAQNFRKHKETLLNDIKNKYGEDSKIYKKAKEIFENAPTLRHAQLELYKTTDKNLINAIFETGIFEKYGELTNSDSLQFRSHSLKNKATTNEKILETFELLRDPNNDYHLGKRVADKIEKIELAV